MGGAEKARFQQRNDEEMQVKRKLSDPLYLERFGYKVYSQNDEDGIIAEIFNRIGTTNKTFVEFGVQDGLENNTHYLLHQGWSGLWIEGSKKFYNQVIKKFQKPISQNRLTIINAFINVKNINSLIETDGRMSGEIDLLSIDIDGNDYWVWEAIKSVSARVVVIEYNAKFPPTCKWIMSYDENHIWNHDDEQGASLKALELLGERLGYQLVGTNLTGCNAFFVKSDLTKSLFASPASAENLYNSWKCNRIKYVSGHLSKRYIGE